jgi:hypothetical protein
MTPQQLDAYDEQVAAAFQSYDARVADAGQRDAFGRLARPPHDRLAVNVAGGALLTNSDYADPLVRPTVGLDVRYAATPRIGVGLGLSGGGLAADRAFERTYVGAEALLHYTVLPRSTLTPFLTVSAGALYLLDSDADSEQTFAPTLGASAGLELAIAPQVGVTLSAHHTYALSDALDDVERGRYNDNAWSLRSGITFYFR